MACRDCRVKAQRGVFLCEAGAKQVGAGVSASVWEYMTQREGVYSSKNRESIFIEAGYHKHQTNTEPTDGG